VYQFARPKLDTINLAECVDMDCDGLKRAMIVDVDGSLTGTAYTTLLAQSEYHYERWVETEPHYYLSSANVPNHEDFPVSNPQRGMGDFRIPWSMVTRQDGSRIPYGDYAEKIGTIRDFDHCAWEPRQNGYNCPNRKMATLLLESFDHDRETRRFAPVALRENGQKLVDLGNGVIDHSCCFGYSCQLRLAQHYFNVECGKTYEFHAAGTVPKHSRFHLLGLNSEDDDCQIRVDYFVARQNRQKIYRDDVYVTSKQESTNVEGDTVWAFPDDALKPSPTTDGPGSNYFQRMEQVVYFNIDAGHYIDIKSSNTLLLELEVVTEMTIDQFWDSDDLANLLAVMLGISADKIKKMNVISESSARRFANNKSLKEILRKRVKPNKKAKQQAAEPAATTAAPPASSRPVVQRGNPVFVQFEIGATWNEALRSDEQNELNFITEMAGKIVTAIDDGTLADSLQITTNQVAMAVPPKQAELPDWYEPVTEDNVEAERVVPGSTIADKVGLDPDDPETTIELLQETVEEVLDVKIEEVETYEDVQERQEEEMDASDDLIVYSPTDPVEIQVETDIQNDHSMEDGVAITPPIVIYSYNAEGGKIEAPIKNPLDPWRITASIQLSDEGITLSGNVECSFNNLGQCVFDNLIISGVGDVLLSFEITYQANVDPEDDADIGTIDTDKVIVVPTTTPAPITTTAATTQGTGTTPTGTTTSTTTDPSTDPTDEPTVEPPVTTKSPEKEKDQACTIKKNKQIMCNDKNLVTGRKLAIQIMQLSTKARKKVKSLDVSSNPNLNQQTLKAIMKQLPGLRQVKANHMGWESIPKNFFAGLDLKKIDVSNNSLRCIQHAFDGLSMKQLIFKENNFLQDVLDGQTKAKKNKIAEVTNKFNKLPQGGCTYH